MSKQVLIEYFSFSPSPRALHEAKLSPSKNLIVEGVVQRADAKNQNGRVYPKETLLREVEKYMAGPIAENLFRRIRDLLRRQGDRPQRPGQTPPVHEHPDPAAHRPHRERDDRRRGKTLHRRDPSG